MMLKRTIRALALGMSMSNFLPNSLRLKLVRWWMLNAVSLL